MDLGSRVFAAGMSYVSLSRVRSLASLSLLALDPKAIRANPLVKEYYQYIERHGTHKGLRAQINKIPFPTAREIRSLVKVLPALMKRRENDRKRAAEAMEEREGDTIMTSGGKEDTGEPATKVPRTG